VEAFHHLQQAVGQLRQVGEPRCLAQALSFAHETALALGRGAETTAGVDEALELARRTDDQFSMVLALEQKALVQQAAGAFDLAAQLLAEAYTRCTQLGDRWRQAHVLTLQAQLAWQGGDHLLARQRLVAAYQLAQRYSCHAHIPQTLVALAALLAEQGETVRAFTLGQLVRDDPYSTRPLRQRAGHLIDTLTPQVAAAEQAAISARLQNTPVERVVADVLTLA